jgi:heme-degrading monooxygenase HmoA
MFLRIVEATIRENKIRQLESTYREEVLPNLRETDGCLFAGLLQSTDRSGTYMSLTLWDLKDHIRDYTESGKFEENLEQVRPWLESSSEWKIQLSKEDTIEYVPAGNEHVVKSFPVDEDRQKLSEKVTEGRSYLRVLSLKVKSGKEEEFKSIYHNEIQKELEKTEGCRLAFLVDNTTNDDEMLSFTIWDSLEAVSLYENEGIFKKLLNKVRHTLAELYQWKMALDSRGTPAKSVTSRDMDISKFTLVTGQAFE